MQRVLCSKRVLLLSCLLGLASSGTLRGEVPALARLELAELDVYLRSLQAGQAGSAMVVDALADVPLAGVQAILKAYVETGQPAPATHRAFHALLERTTRTALAPWPMLELYDPDFAAWLIRPANENPMARRVLTQLLSSEDSRIAYDLAVRLVPELSLRYLAEGTAAHRGELFEAWNRRLSRGRETRPIPGLDGYLRTVANALRDPLPAARRESHLQFVAFWPALRGEYERGLRSWLEQDDRNLVLAALRVQARSPALLECNAAVIARHAEDEELVAAALRSYAFDDRQDHSATLRALWHTLPGTQTKARYACLYAMGVHARGNDGLALAAVEENTFELLDVALPVLRDGDPARARQAVAHVLLKSKRGHEEALRLAYEAKLDGFFDQAVAIALDPARDQIVRQAALRYLQLAPGRVRLRLLSLFAAANADVRLAAIGVFAAAEGLTPDDRDVAGPALVQVALNDPSFGHRQEALYALGKWKAPAAADVFRRVLQGHPPVDDLEGHYNDEMYWRYRLRLVALLGLARLDDAPARDELMRMHRDGGPTERMDAMLALLDLGRSLPGAVDDLASREPKLAATAATLIARQGTPQQRAAMHEHFRRTPLFLAFDGTGLDDHNLLELAGLGKEPQDVRP